MTASTFNALAAARLATGSIPRPRRRLYAALRAGRAPGVPPPDRRPTDRSEPGSHRAGGQGRSGIAAVTVGARHGVTRYTAADRKDPPSCAPPTAHLTATYPFDWTEGDRPRTRARVRRASDSVWSAWCSYGTVTAAL